MKNKYLKIIVPISLGLLATFIFKSCSPDLPKGVEPVKNFDSEKYLGTWYEIARFDYRFEKNLNQVTANYSLKDNGNIKVVNKGYNYLKKKWKEADGEAKFVNSETVAQLEVSFFKPFWSGYNVVEIDDDYRYALVAGESLDYLWILSREKTIPEDVKTKYLEKAKSIGFDVSKLVWVEH